MTDYLAKYGLIVVENGYSICFIRPGEKRPFGNDWEAKTHGPKRIASASGRNFGVGIKTAKTPLVDIDCYDAKLVAHMAKFTEALVGPALRRVGMPPKLGMVYRSSKPFPKTQSKVFIDDEGRAVKLEVLGDGQQFVALAIHPDTGKPYRWDDKRHPGVVPWEELVEITREDALEIVGEFERMARKRGWPEKTTIKRLDRGDVDLDDPFITDKQKVDLSLEQLRAKLQMVDNADDYDTWFQIGMGLYHQFDGAQDGLDLWHEWSADAHNYDSDALDDKWPTFEIEGKKREPLTARIILKLAQANEERIATEEFDEIREAIDECEDTIAIRKVCERIKHVAFDSIQRATIVSAVTKKLKAMGTNMSVSAVSQLCRYENPDNSTTPPWLKQFVYCQHDDTFYSTRTRQTLSSRVFDASFARYMMSRKDQLEGRSTPEHTASHVALNRYQIEVVANRMYYPGEEDIFEVYGLRYVNTYSTGDIPEVPEKFAKRHKHAIATVERHLEHLFPNEKDRKLLLSWLAYITQTGKRVNWAPIIQGVESDGKSFFHLLMQGVLGGGNVRTIGGDALGEKNTAWAEGVQFCFIEEVRLHGKDRFAVVNKVKPYITNQFVAIRRMQTDWYDVVNTVNYLMTTNHKDGVPVAKSDTRYYPMFSRWQNEIALAHFNKQNPTYYVELHAVLEEVGALRKWLLEMELDKTFDPVKRAPVSSSKSEMVYLNQSDEEEALHAGLEESEEADCCAQLLDSAKVSDLMTEHGASAPYGRGLKMLLSEAGFTFLGLAKIDGKTRRYWSQTPEKFRDTDAKIDTSAVRKWIEDGIKI